MCWSWTLANLIHWKFIFSALKRARDFIISIWLLLLLFFFLCRFYFVWCNIATNGVRIFCFWFCSVLSLNSLKYSQMTGLDGMHLIFLIAFFLFVVRTWISLFYLSHWYYCVENFRCRMKWRIELIVKKNVLHVFFSLNCDPMWIRPTILTMKSMSMATNNNNLPYNFFLSKQSNEHF